MYRSLCASACIQNLPAPVIVACQVPTSGVSSVMIRPQRNSVTSIPPDPDTIGLPDGGVSVSRVVSESKEKAKVSRLIPEFTGISIVRGCCGLIEPLAQRTVETLL